MSDSENEAPEPPIIGTVGIILSIAYRAVNIETVAMSLVFWVSFVMLNMFGYLQPCFLCRSVVFYTAYN